MAKTETIRARVEPELKEEAEAVLERLGMTPTEAITLFYRQVTLQRGLPFSVRLPNAETRRAMNDARTGRNLKTWRSLDDLKSASG